MVQFLDSSDRSCVQPNPTRRWTRRLARCFRVCKCSAVLVSRTKPNCTVGCHVNNSPSDSGLATKLELWHHEVADDSMVLRCESSTLQCVPTADQRHQGHRAAAVRPGQPGPVPGGAYRPAVGGAGGDCERQGDGGAGRYGYDGAVQKVRRGPDHHGGQRDHPRQDAV